MNNLSLILFIGFLWGLLFGIIPLFFGAATGNIKGGFCGLFGTIFVSLMFGILGAIPTSAISVYLIKK